MIADIIRAAIQLVFRDKIVAGIVIVSILGIFYCGASHKDPNGHRFISNMSNADQADQKDGGDGQAGGDKGQDQQKPQADGQGKDQNQAQSQGQGQGQGQNAAGGQAGQKPQQVAVAPPQPPPGLEPALAVKFVRWWLTMALDYSQNSPANHKKAMAYARPPVVKMFTQSFYTPEVMAGVANGTLAGSFEPVTVQAIAINPDGSVVVTVIGTLSMQSSGSQPVSQNLVLEFCVEKDPEGVHMAGFFNKTITTQPTQPGGSPQPQDAPSGPPQFEGQ